MKFSDIVLGTVVILVCLVSIYEGIAIGKKSAMVETHKTAIDMGCAVYDSKTGVWAWQKVETAQDAIMKAMDVPKEYKAAPVPPHKPKVK